MSIRLKLILAYCIMIVFGISVVIFGMIKVTANFFTNVSESMIGDHSIDEVAHAFFNVMVDVEYMSQHEQEKFEDVDYMKEIERYLADFNLYLFVEKDGKMIYTSQFRDDIPLQDFYKQLDFDNADDHHYDRTNDPFVGATYIYNGEKLLIVKHEIDATSEAVGDLYVVMQSAEPAVVGKTIFKDMFGAIFLLLIIILVTMTIVITQMVIKPLKVLEDSTLKIRQGQLDFSVKSNKNDEIGRVMNAFDTMRSELKRSIEQQIQYEENRKELIASISHDLKTPITSIKGYVEGIKDGVANDQDKLDQYLDVIYDKSVDLDQLIDDLFLFSKLDLNRVPFNFASVSAYRFFEDSYEALKMDLEKVGFKLKYNNTLGKETKVTIDPQQFKRIMTNIVGNAVKYSLDIKEVELSVWEDEHKIHMAIKDFGKGISQEDLAQIFDKFYRCDPARNTDIVGSGLGLAIAKQIIDQHGGEIWAESELEVGTTIYMMLERLKGEQGE